MNCCVRWRRECRWWNVANRTSPSNARKKLKQLVYVPRGRIAAALHSRFALRFHTSILLLWCFSAGLLTTKGLFALGMQSMFLRYTMAIVVAYGAFLLGVRLWLAYVGAGAARNVNRTRSTDRIDGSPDIPDLSFPGGGSSGGGSPGPFSGGGGSSGGGGASGSFDGGAAPQPNQLVADIANTNASSGGCGGDSSVFGDVGKVGDVVGDIGGDEGGCLIAFALMIVVGLIALAIGGAVFVITMGPEILIDAAFSALLAGGLIKSTKTTSDPDWIGSVMKATWLPFGIVLVVMWIFAGTAAVLTPQAHTFSEVWRLVWPLLLESIG